MPNSRRNLPYYDLVEASKQYLGPAGERFMRRQIYMHLEKEPEGITPHEIRELIKWIRPAFALITNNKVHLDTYIAKLERIAQKHNNNSNHRKQNAELTSS